MRTTLTLLMLIVLLPGACRSSVDPADQFYRRWKLVDGEYYLTFQPDGIVLHGKDGNDTYCCTPRYFIRQYDKLYFDNAPQEKLPSTIREANCGYVKCAGPGPFWQIVALDAQQLVIKTSYAMNTYEPYP